MSSSLDKDNLDILDTTRIDLVIPTIKELINKNVRLIIIAHQGRKGSWDFISLEKGEIEAKDVVKNLIKTLESYTNGGFNIIKEKQESSRRYFQISDSFLRFMNNL